MHASRCTQTGSWNKSMDVWNTLFIQLNTMFALTVKTISEVKDLCKELKSEKVVIKSYAYFKNWKSSDNA